jgi:hypothetical protein
MTISDCHVSEVILGSTHVAADALRETGTFQASIHATRRWFMKSNGLATVLLLIPVLTVPALAIFGIPQFAPVVASPIDESRNFDRESREGNSSRHSQDELFDEIEGISSEPEVKPGSGTSLRNRGTSKPSQREKGLRRTDSGLARSSENGANWPNSPRQPAFKKSDEMAVRDRFYNGNDATDVPQQKALPRQQRQLSAVVKTNEEIRQAKVEDPDQTVTPSGFTEDSQFRDQPGNSGEDNRNRLNDSLGSNRRVSRSEPLTWAAAVERLNEFDIRNFRLEPGNRSGQFVFICSYTSPDAPSVSYRFEAIEDEPLKAVEKVIEQIVEWRQNR